MAEQFGRYELLRRIGAGGMAEVYKAKTFGPEGFVKEVVIKRILPAFNEDPDFVEMFINEARLAARLQHTNIVQIFDFNQVDGVYYIAMEWVEGADLRRIINRSRRRSRPIPVRAAVHVGVETLKGLHYASTRTEEGKPLNLVHRDISPHNLLVSFAGEVKITDFGIAKVAALASSTRSGMLKGKLGYMSPEQAAGAVLDARSDIFSLGIVLWELLAGRRLYQGDSEGELFAQVKRAEVPPPRTLRDEIDEGLERALMRMLATDRDERFASAAEALEELSRHAAGGDSLAVSAYLRDLLPDDVGRGGGGTKVLPEPTPRSSPVAVAPPDAPTHTRDPGGARAAAAAAPLQRAETGSGSPGTLSLSARPTTRREAPRSVGRAARLAALCCWLALCCLGGWWLGALSCGGEQPGGARKALLVRSQPSGAELWVDGVALGKTPRQLFAAPGATLTLVARKGGRSAERSVAVEAGEVVLALDVPASRPVPDASVAPDGGAEREKSALAVAKGPTKRPPTPAHRRRHTKPDAGVSSRRTEPKGWGRLTVAVRPWARVKIDGREAGSTPVSIRLRPGRHRIELHNSELEKRETVPIEIRVGRQTSLRRNWE